MYQDLLRIFIVIELLQSIYTCNTNIPHILKFILQVEDLNGDIVFISEYKPLLLLDNIRECSGDSPTQVVILNTLSQRSTPEKAFVSRFSSPKSLVLSHLSFNNLDFFNSTSTHYRTSVNMHHVFLLDNSNQNFIDDSIKPSLAKSTTRLLKIYFLLSTPKTWHIYLRNAKRDGIILATSIKKGNFSSNERVIPLRKRTDFELETITTSDCPICGNTLEIFQQTGIWTTASTAFFYELALNVNATLDIVPTFGMVLKGRAENGQWDEFIQSVVDETATMTAYAQPTSCAYKSKLVGLIALPKFSPEPTTFEKLAESDYKIMSVLFAEQVEADLRIKNTSVATAILNRTMETDFVEPDCYKGIFEDKAACIGYSAVFGSLGIRFMVDIKKRKMFKTSSESWFFAYLSIGISMNFPELLDPMNNIVRSFENGGIVERWKVEQLKYDLKTGQNNAMQFSIWTHHRSIISAYNVILLGNADRNFNFGGSKKALAKSAQKLKNAYFLLSVPEFWYIYLRNARSDNLVLSKVFPKGSISLRTPKNPLQKYPNFELQTISSADCSYCGDTLEIFQQTGIWTDPSTAFFYELAQRVNATLEIIPTLGMVFKGKDENGEWDEFTKSIIDDTATLSAFVVATGESLDIIQVTHPYLFDKMCFVYALPQPIKFNPLGRLVRPFSLTVWASVIISILATFAALKIILGYKTTRDKNKKSDILSIFASIVKPLLDQASVDTKTIAKHASRSLSRIVLGIWLLLLISLGCAYKSKLVELIALPKFNPEPTTFAALAASDYKIMSILFAEHVEADLRIKNTTVTRTILSRAIEKDFMVPDCFRGIFEEKAVCIGYSFVFWSRGILYMVDVKKRPMFKVSSESWFFGYLTMGISLNFPELLEPLNSVLRSVGNGGLVEHWQKERLKYDLKTGQKNAITFATENVLYKGNVHSVDDFNNFSFLLMEVMLFALILGGVAFTVE
ncbi:unnamed protein product, partial [Allacma fusca]